uniref:G-patch domain-containing protein n=1 Tax=Syphacia muris TaxID=451379 RepID=A0A0N5AVD9_9BILA
MDNDRTVNSESAETNTLNKISFGVKKKKETVNNALNILNVNKFDEDENLGEPDVKKHRVSVFDGNEAKKDNSSASSDNLLVIPLSVGKDWRMKRLLQKKMDNTLTKEEEAQLALMSSSLKEETGKDDDSISDASDTETDYNSVKLDIFGLAVLRGCGWRDGEGIGKNNVKVVLSKIAERRPVGLGLGNDVSKYRKDRSKNIEGKNAKEDYTLKKGAYVEIKNGSYRGKYGQIQSFDEDNCSVIVKLAITKENVRINEYSVLVVSAEEYERDSRCINKKEYDDAKKHLEDEQRKRSVKSLRDKKEPHRQNERYADHDVPVENRKKSKRAEMWVRPELKVRFINKSYKNGKLFKEKVMVIDAADQDNCTIRDDRGQLYYQICEEWLETVIPQEGSRVMIVGGRWRGNLGVLEIKERKRERVVVRLLHSEDIVKVPYDDVCQWVGESDDDY